MAGFPFEKLAPLPWRMLGLTSVADASDIGPKVFATTEQSFPERGERESRELAKAIMHRVNVHDELMTMLRECRATFAFAAGEGDDPAHQMIAEIDAVLAKAGAS